MIYHYIIRPALNDAATAGKIRKKMVDIKIWIFKMRSPLREKREAKFFNKVFRQFVWVLTEVLWRQADVALLSESAHKISSKNSSIIHL